MVVNCGEETRPKGGRRDRPARVGTFTFCLRRKGEAVVDEPVTQDLATRGAHQRRVSSVMLSLLKEPRKNRAPKGGPASGDDEIRGAGEAAVVMQEGIKDLKRIRRKCEVILDVGQASIAAWTIA